MACWISSWKAPPRISSVVTWPSLSAPHSRATTSPASRLTAAIAAWKSDVPATIATYTVDRLAYSLSPPVVVGVLDFEGGGRFTCELTDVDPAAVKIGKRVEMTFRRLLTAREVHNYFWKARPSAA